MSTSSKWKLSCNLHIYMTDALNEKKNKGCCGLGIHIKTKYMHTSNISFCHGLFGQLNFLSFLAGCISGSDTSTSTVCLVNIKIKILLFFFSR